MIDPGADPDELRRSLVALPGIGPWTAEYVAMRALRDPDAFMPTDLGIRRAAPALGLPDDPAAPRRRRRRLAAVAQLRHGPPVVAPAAGTPISTTPERTCSMTTAPTATMPLDTPVGRLVLECDGDVLIGVWLPHERRHGAATSTTCPRC